MGKQLSSNLIKSLTLCVLLLALFCCKRNPGPGPTVNNSPYAVSGTRILYQSKAIQLIGANTFHVFSAGGSDMQSWHMDVAREFIGNVKETPLSGSVIKDSNGSYLYSLQTIVDSNRKAGRITIIGAFGWDGTGNTMFTGTRPTQTSWWSSFESKLQQWAVQFKDQPDVWLEVWNEPYRYDGADGYTDDIWVSDMNALVTIVRNAGNNNIVLVPCAKQGQDETVLINKGKSFLNGKSNIIFDVHAYERWLLDAPANIGTRLGLLQQQGLALIFGETAPMNAGTLMNPQPFLDSAYHRGLSICAWTWKYSNTDQDALLGTDGSPNNNNNNNWGSTYKAFAAQSRNP